MDALMHTAKDHTKKWLRNFKINSDIVKEAIKSDNKEHLDKSTKFKCAECKKMFSINDKFKEDLKETQMCKLFLPWQRNMEISRKCMVMPKWLHCTFSGSI